MVKISLSHFFFFSWTLSFLSPSLWVYSDQKSWVIGLICQLISRYKILCVWKTINFSRAWSKVKSSYIPVIFGMHELKEMEIKHDMVRRKEKKNSEKQAFGHSSSQVWLEGHSSSHLLCVCISHTHIVTVLLGKFKFNVDCEILSACKALLILIMFLISDGQWSYHAILVIPRHLGSLNWPFILTCRYNKVVQPP